MLLSKILEEMGDTTSEIVRDKDFDSMGILISGYSGSNRCVFVMDESYLGKLDDSVAVVITTRDLAKKIYDMDKGVCISLCPRTKFYQIHNFLSTTDAYKRKEEKTLIDSSSNVSPLAAIATMNVKIGANVIIENFVDIKENVIIEDNVIIRSGAVIGGPGYDYKEIDGKLTMTAQIGGIILRKGVEIGSNTCIERAAFPYEDTEIGEETKIGSLCYVSHGVKIGRKVRMPNCVSISGYSRIGDGASIGPNATISNVIHVGSNAFVSLGSVVATSVRRGKHVSGNFAITHDKFLKKYMDDMRK